MASLKGAAIRIGRFVAFTFGATSAVRQVKLGKDLIGEIVGNIEQAHTPKRVDDRFEAVVAQNGLTDQDLERMARIHLLNKRVLIILAGLLTGGVVGAIITGFVSGVIAMTPMVPMCLVLAAKQHFRLTQIRERRLLSFTEYASGRRWLAQSLDLEI